MHLLDLHKLGKVDSITPLEPFIVERFEEIGMGGDDDLTESTVILTDGSKWEMDMENGEYNCVDIGD